ncbi:MAG: DNA polymerase I [Actinobacteria bacterium]|nr:DNA polymerase I [Actinomycetota bacterium]
MNPAAEQTVQPDLSGALFLIDGNSLAYRAFYALPETIATSDGFPTNALYGFSTMLVKILNDYEPANVMVAWDTGKKVFRHEEYEDYKAGRKPMPDNLSLQFEHFEDLVNAFGFENLRKEGYEADDILATIVREAREEKRKVVVVTADRDALQLVGGGIFVMSNSKGISEVKIYDEEAVEARYCIPPRKVPDYIGLKGDTSDNIPGVPGIGDKTAAALLADRESLEDLLAHLDEIKGKRRELLEEYQEQALMSKQLATMHDEVPLERISLDAAPAHPGNKPLRDFLTRFEFTSLIRRLEETGMLEPPEVVEEKTGIEKTTLGKLIAALAGGEAAIAWKVHGKEIDLALFYAAADRVLLADAPVDGFESAVEKLVGVPEKSEDGKSAAGSATPAPAGPATPASAGPAPACHDYKSLMAIASRSIPCSHDTMVAAYLLRPAARTYELDQLAAASDIRIELPADAAENPRDHDLVLAAIRTHHLARAQRLQLDDLGLTELFITVEMPLIGVLSGMERTGIRIDLPRLGELASRVDDQLEQLAAEIHNLAGEQDFNIDSPQQLSAILFEKLLLPTGKKTKTGYSTDASVLKNLREQHPIIEKIETYRELAKLSGTYLQALPRLADPDTWRIHTTFNQTVTATGRISSSDPNLQNIPIRTPLGEKIRDCFVPEEGSRLVVADYSQVELRIMAHLSEEPKLRQAFAAGDDVHRDTAAEVFNIAPSEVDSTQRNRAKAVNFGIMYGISAYGLSEQLGISHEEAAGYIKTYLARYPKVAAFRDQIIEQATEAGFVTTMLGRRRLIPELRSAEDRVRKLGERLAVNTVIQGSAADIMKVAMVNADRALAGEGLKARMVLQVHDELVFEAPETEASVVAELARREMAAAWELDPPLEVDVGVGETWVEAK